MTTSISGSSRIGRFTSPGQPLRPARGWSGVRTRGTRPGPWRCRPPVRRSTAWAPPPLHRATVPQGACQLGCHRTPRPSAGRIAPARDRDGAAGRPLRGTELLPPAPARLRALIAIVTLLVVAGVTGCAGPRPERRQRERSVAHGLNARVVDRGLGLGRPAGHAGPDADRPGCDARSRHHAGALAIGASAEVFPVRLRRSTSRPAWAAPDRLLSTPAGCSSRLPRTAPIDGSSGRRARRSFSRRGRPTDSTSPRSGQMRRPASSCSRIEMAHR